MVGNLRGWAMGVRGDRFGGRRGGLLCLRGPAVRMIAVIAASAALVGCSTSRSLDFPSFGLTNKSDATASLPRPSVPVYGYAGPSGAGAQEQSLSEAGRGQSDYRSEYRSDYAAPQPQRQTYAAPERPVAAPERRLSPDQPLTQRVNTAIVPPVAKPAARLQLADAAVPSQRPKLVPQSSVAPRSGSHTVAAGDTLYSIAKRHGVTVEALRAENGLSGSDIRVGQSLAVPGNTAAPAQVAAAAPRKRLEPRAHAGTGPQANPAIKGVALNPQASVSVAPALTEKPSDSEAVNIAMRGLPNPAERPDAGPGTGGQPKFRWPVRGKVISKFGSKPDGSHNDGVNFAVPPGTAVHAAEEGTVAYAGNELKGFGNLVLIRHSGNWVTVYAHNDQLLVKRGDTVRRGQLVAKSGRSGSVQQPQLHFEVRQGSKPVDPFEHLPAL